MTNPFNENSDAEEQPAKNRRRARVQELHHASRPAAAASGAAFLLTRERPAVTEVVTWAAGNGIGARTPTTRYGKKRLREIDRRIRFLRKRIDAAEIVDPEAPRSGRAGTSCTSPFRRWWCSPCAFLAHHFQSGRLRAVLFSLALWAHRSDLQPSIKRRPLSRR